MSAERKGRADGSSVNSAARIPESPVAGERAGGATSARSSAALVRDPDTGEEFDPYEDDFGHELDCTHCGGEGTCDDNANPLWDCDDNLHPCHSCGGSGKRRDQRVF